MKFRPKQPSAVAQEEDPQLDDFTLIGGDNWRNLREYAFRPGFINRFYIDELSAEDRVKLDKIMALQTAQGNLDPLPWPSEEESEIGSQVPDTDDENPVVNNLRCDLTPTGDYCQPCDLHYKNAQEHCKTRCHTTHAGFKMIQRFKEIDEVLKGMIKKTDPPARKR